MGYSSLRCLGFLLRWLLLLLSVGSSMCGLQSLMCVLRSCTLQALDMSLVVVAHGPSCSETHRISPDQELNSCPLYWPWIREWQSTPVFLLGESHVLRSLAVYSPWGCKELDMTEWLSTLALVGRFLTSGSSRKPPKSVGFDTEKPENSGFLAWRIPGTGEPGELPSMGSHRVGHGHNWSDLAAAAGGDSKDKRGDREAKKNHHVSGHQNRYGPQQNFTYITASQLFYSPENFNKGQKKLQQPTGHFWDTEDYQGCKFLKKYLGISWCTCMNIPWWL